MDLREVGYDDRDWINLAQDRDRWRAYAYRICIMIRASPFTHHSAPSPPGTRAMDNNVKLSAGRSHDNPNPVSRIFNEIMGEAAGRLVPLLPSRRGRLVPLNAAEDLGDRQSKYGKRHDSVTLHSPELTDTIAYIDSSSFLERHNHA
ncbi:hypothetical protein ANN_05381 [Periplaneta americana]|uniref:Uncharacterized protein n=1 Tax=Periplaneta americana TaxID=6978 RepID=A0ABQ8TCA0_PERAM|nr:hypothetical protein ANN_05381 [Periplaneta americana]